MNKRLSDDQLRGYHDDGFEFPVDILSPLEAAGYRKRLEALEAERGRFNYAMKPYLSVMMADEIAHDDRVLDAVEDIIGPNILLWDGAFIIKEPGDGNFVSWHQDLTYWGIEPPDGLVSVWLALSPSRIENGCMRIIPGTHRLGILPHEDRYGENNLLSRGQTIPGVDEGRAVDIELAPGQMSLHHGRVVHGSSPSDSDERRIGLNLQYIAPHVQQTAISNDSAMLVRGRDTHEHFTPEPRPTSDFAPESLALAAEIAKRRHKVLFDGADDSQKGRYGAIT